MKTKIVRSALAAFLLFGGVTTLSAQVIPGRYIAVFEDSVVSPPAAAQALAAQHGLQVSYLFQSALRGFAFTGSPQAAAALAGRNQISYIEQEQVYQAIAQTVPTGIRRANGPADYRDGSDDALDVDIAIIDTGILATHPELRIAGGVRYYTQGPFLRSDSNYNDGNGHGTHVAGTAAAIDNSSGVVGVAPGARLWAVKVLGDNGSGSTSAVIAGLDWVRQRASTIEVANMSLGGGFSQALNDAVRNTVAAGVVVVVAAGNETTNVAARSPASEATAITVSALADSDGTWGGNGLATSHGADDTFATFSNYGAGVDVMAPGVSILSTYLSNGYGVGSGTSMASPHVAGAAAAYVVKNGLTKTTAGVKTVEDAIKAAGWSAGEEGYISGGTGDSDAEPVLNVAGLLGTSSGGDPEPSPADETPPHNVTVTSLTDGATVSGTTTITASAEDNVGVTEVEFFVDGVSLGKDTNSSGGWSWSWNTAAYSNGNHALKVTARDAAGNSATSADVNVTVNNGVVEDSMHVGGLVGVSSNHGSSWSATVTVTILDASNEPVEGATVEGAWSGGYTGSISGNTDAGGKVSFTTGSTIPKRNGSVTFAVDGVGHETLSYNSGANVASSVTVGKP